MSNIFSFNPQYPDILTAGVFKKAGAKREDLKNLKFTVTQIGHGWSEKLAEGSDEYASPPDSSIIVKVIYTTFTFFFSFHYFDVFWC